MTSVKEKYHFIGIGGIGMSGLAKLLLAQNQHVQGSDKAHTLITEELNGLGATIFKKQEGANIRSDLTVVFSSDIKNDNPEFSHAVSLKCPLMHRSDLLKKLMTDSHTLAVAGTHGKTTTSSLLTEVLDHAGNDPTFVVGGILAKYGTNARHGKGNHFVAEADESDGSFLKYHPYGAIVTNIDNDHMNYFQTKERLIHSFKQFMSQVSSKKHLLWCADDPHLVSLNMAGISYGFSESSQARISNFTQKKWSIFFDLTYEGKHYSQIEVSLTGRHNALNSAAVFILALNLGCKEELIRSSLIAFKGVGRRAEKKGEIHGIEFIDDYGHHPTEIRATLKAIRQVAGPKRIVAVFQPHRYSRVQDCIGEFGPALEEADEVILTDIYAAGETSIEGITAHKLIPEIEKYTSCHYIPRSTLAEELAKMLYPHDVCITLGAGDVTLVGPEIISYLKTSTPRKLKVGVICGGRSNEHEVSLLSVKNVLKQLKKEFYDITLFTIAKTGEWSLDDNKKSTSSLISKEVNEKLFACDLFFPVLHGPFGEDGTLQGFLESLGKPYVGCDHRSAAICMDKALTKKLARLEGVPTLDFVAFRRFEWKAQKEKILEKILTQLRFPVFVKPLHLGSTMGVFRVSQKEDLANCIDKAFRVDTEILVENGLEHPREIEFSLLGNDDPTVFPPGEILTQGKIYSYVGKYSQDDKAVGVAPKANLAPHIIEEGMKLAKKAYLAARCCGFARVDFFLDRDEKLWFNEINPIPGCTNNSLYPKMCEVNGLLQSDLMDQLIQFALQRFRENRCLLNVCYE